MVYYLQYQLATPGLDYRLGVVNGVCVEVRILEDLAEAGWLYGSSVCWIRRTVFLQRLILHIECTSSRAAEIIDQTVRLPRLSSEAQLDSCLAQAEAMLGETICLDVVRFYQVMTELLSRGMTSLPNDPGVIADPTLDRSFRYDWISSRRDHRSFRLQMIYLQVVRPGLTDRLILPVVRMIINDQLDRLTRSFGASYNYSSVMDYGDDNLTLHYRYLTRRQLSRCQFRHQLEQLLSQLTVSERDCDYFRRSIQVGMRYFSPADIYSSSGVLAGVDDLVKNINVENINRTLRRLRLRAIDYLEVTEADYA
ncbi:MAG: hypothetical protein ACFNZD_03210 [Candidatus Nanoperiomorbus sp.]